MTDEHESEDRQKSRSRDGISGRVLTLGIVALLTELVTSVILIVVVAGEKVAQGHPPMTILEWGLAARMESSPIMIVEWGMSSLSGGVDLVGLVYLTLVYGFAIKIALVVVSKARTRVDKKALAW